MNHAFVVQIKNIKNVAAGKMLKEINPQIVADLIIRLSSLENLLIEKKVILQEEYFNEVKNTTEKVVAEAVKMLNESEEKIVTKN